MCEKCFVQTKNYSSRIYFHVMKKIHFEFNYLEKFLQISLKQFRCWGGGCQKRAKLFVALPGLQKIHFLLKNTLALNAKMYFFQKQTYVTKMYFFKNKLIFSKFCAKCSFSQFQFLKSSWIHPMVLKILSDAALDGQRVSRSSVHWTSA